MAPVLSPLPRHWPAPHDVAAAERLIERFAAAGHAEQRLSRRPDIAALLRCLGGNSPYLADLAVREAGTIGRLAELGPDAVVRAAMAELAAVPAHAKRDPVAAALRRAKRVVALSVAVADIGGVWRLEHITEALSALAEAALSLAVAHLLRAAHDAGDLHLPNPADPASGSGFTVLGMGKLGARELNYSSDVDLVLIYDPAAVHATSRSAGDAMGRFMVRLSRDLVALMEARDDGYVFRTDLRLRPDPAATPPAVALGAALTYYESMGQNWERAAMIKARPVAGDLALGWRFLEAIRPFVWRRGLDFAAVADIHAMKRRIDQHKGTALGTSRDPVARVAGHNVKLGEGGIREIEFMAQTLQLVWGGRDPAFRTPMTLTALRLLARAGLIPARAAAELATAYRFLRRVEHRLQMVADRQTHEVPRAPADLARIATFMGYASAAAFATALLRQLGRVRARYREVFALLPDLPGGARAGAALDFAGDGPAPAATTAALTAMGYTAPDRVVAAVRAWQAGHVRALRSARARELMGTMLPLLLERLAARPHPDDTFSRFDRFIAAQPTGVQLLSLFQHNPTLLDRVAAVLGASPRLADHLALHPASLEGLLWPDEGDPPPRQLRARLRDARLLEDVIEITRRAVKAEDFAVSVAQMEGRLDADAAGERRSAMAQAALAALLPPVIADFSAKFGSVRGGGMVVVALGKAGGREMMAESDLDLMLIYDHPETVSESRGGRALPASQWFVRAAHAAIAAITAPGVEGQLYEVDMRLRPSGNKGPVAVSLTSFQRYHAEDAWTWERMALTRARVVAGPPGLKAKVEAAIAAAVADSGDAATIRTDAAAMRTRLARDLPPEGPWDVKPRSGGQIEVEFVGQALQLIHARARPHVCHPTLRIALRRLAEAGVLPEADAALLIHADHVWRTVQGMLRIVVGRSVGDAPPEAAARPLLTAAAAAGLDAVDVAGLSASLDKLAHQVRAVFVRQIGEVGS